MKSLEDAALQTINLSGISTGSPAESAQPLQISAVSGNTAVIPDPTVTYTAPSTIGTHLGRVLRKLGLRSRVELSQYFGR